MNMTAWEWIVLVGAISTIANFIINVIGTVLAMKRTHIQETIFKWKVEKYNERR